MYVYFVQSAQLGLIKIGRAPSPLNRVSALRTSSADQLTLMGVIKDIQTEALEAKLHRRFAKARAHGEWFRPAPALLRYIATNAGPICAPTDAEFCARQMVTANWD